jgi:ketosteroid isomerase-like protein
MHGSSDEPFKAEVAAFIRSFFEVGRNKELASVMGFHAPTNVFTKFDENPPYTRQNSEDAFVLEQAAFANISDYQYTIEEMRIDLVGAVAVATFYLTMKGVFVNDYSFEGMTVGSRSRVTMVVARFERGLGIVHEHFSPFPDISKKETLRS